MTVYVVIRIDDVTPFALCELYNIMRYVRINIPLSIYLMYTNYYSKNIWELIAMLIEDYNWEVGGHSISHRNLTKIPINEMQYEIECNINDIIKNLKEVGKSYYPISFAYPYGAYNTDVIKVLKKCNIFFGLTYPPYQRRPVLYVSDLKDRFRVGITVCSDNKSAEDLNRFFEKLLRLNINLYILCAHTRYYANNFLTLVKSFIQSGRNHYKDVVLLMLKSLKTTFKNIDNWRAFFKHIKYLNSKSFVEFVTFRELLNASI